jgi:hypothetical protein
MDSHQENYSILARWLLSVEHWDGTCAPCTAGLHRWLGSALAVETDWLHIELDMNIIIYHIFLSDMITYLNILGH